MIGKRHVQMQVVNAAVLMQEVFPRAKHVEWYGYEPNIKESKPYHQRETFVTLEELNSLVMHVMKPRRFHHANTAPQRPWETLISIMLKYPWHMTGHILTKDRDLLWETCMKVIKPLQDAIAADTEHEDMCLTQGLLIRFCAAVRKCKGFTVAQRYEIHNIAGVKAEWVPHPGDWIWQALGPTKTIVEEYDVLEFYMDLINRLSTKDLTLEEQSRLKEESKDRPAERGSNRSVWGPIKIHYPANFENATMAEIARVEFLAIDNCLRKLLPRPPPI